MTDEEPENLILRYLREIRTDQRATSEDIRDVRRRISNLESNLAGLRSDVSLLHSIAAQESARTDNIIDRLERIEKRLGLVDA